MTGPTEPLFIDQDAVRSTLDPGRVVDALRAAYEAEHGPATGPPRTVARHDGARLRALTAALPSGDVMGTKLVAQPRAAASTYLIALFDQNTGALLALLDAEAITTLRTGATSALAIDALAPSEPLRLGVIGSGAEARSHVQAIAALRPIGAVAVFSPTPASRESFAAWIGSDLGLAAEPVGDAAAVVAGSSTLVCAARSRDEQPVIDGRELNPATLVVSVGSTLPEQRELDVETLRRAELIVADAVDEVLKDSGDCLAAAAEGLDLAAKTISLNELIRDGAGSREEAIAVYKSVGSSIQDVAVAKLVYEDVRAAGGGLPVPIHLTPKGS